MTGCVGFVAAGHRVLKPEEGLPPSWSSGLNWKELGVKERLFRVLASFNLLPAQHLNWWDWEQNSGHLTSDFFWAWLGLLGVCFPVLLDVMESLPET